jgi:hypothetical protein
MAAVIRPMRYDHNRPADLPSRICSTLPHPVARREVISSWKRTRLPVHPVAGNLVIDTPACFAALRRLPGRQYSARSKFFPDGDLQPVEAVIACAVSMARFKGECIDLVDRFVPK